MDDDSIVELPRSTATSVATEPMDNEDDLDDISAGPAEVEDRPQSARSDRTEALPSPPLARLSDSPEMDAEESPARPEKQAESPSRPESATEEPRPRSPPPSDVLTTMPSIEELPDEVPEQTTPTKEEKDTDAAGPSTAEALEVQTAEPPQPVAELPKSPRKTLAEALEGLKGIHSMEGTTKPFWFNGVDNKILFYSQMKVQEKIWI